MFARVKESRNGEYLQIVENYRDGGRVRQRLVMYVGHYDSIDDALDLMSKELPRARRRATVAERHPFWQSEAKTCGLREEADRLAAKLEELRRFAHEHPDVVERDRARAKRHLQRRRAAWAKRRAVFYSPANVVKMRKDAQILPSRICTVEGCTAPATAAVQDESSLSGESEYLCERHDRELGPALRKHAGE